MAISKKDLQEYSFRSIEEYFDYILESYVNGQPQQAKALIQALSKPQRKTCYNWLQNTELESDNEFYNKCLSRAKTEVYELI